MQDVLKTIVRQGHVFLPAATMRQLLISEGELTDWEVFSESWDDLHVDAYMADQGRYRRRRYAVYSSDAFGAIQREAHQPHYQSRDYNPINGGIERWFEPIELDLGDGPSLSAVLNLCKELFDRLMPKNQWHIEVHQFRIEATSELQGLPTPEGVHRDGVDYVLVLLIRRQNIASGTTTIHTTDGTLLGSFTLTAPFDAVLVDDARVAHGVTAVIPVDASKSAYRDVLVVTFRRK